MQQQHLGELSRRKAELIARACGARERASSYRGFKVGAAVLAWNGTEYDIFTGINMKPGPGVQKTCAEMVAVANARMAGYHLVVALVTCGIPQANTPTIHPCETCRSILLRMPGMQEDSVIITTNAMTGAEEEWTARSVVDKYAESDVAELWQHHHEKIEWLSDAVAEQIRQNASAHPLGIIFGGVSPPRLPGMLDRLLGDTMRAGHREMLVELGKRMARHELGIVTGACPGASEVVQVAHMEHRPHSYCVSVGVHRNGLKTEQVPHTYRDVLLDCGTFGPRLAMMWRLSDFAIILRGGIGTLLELWYFVQKNQRTGRIVPMYVQSESDFRIITNWIRLLQRKGYVERNLRLPLYHCNPLDVPARVRDDLRRIRGT